MTIFEVLLGIMIGFALVLIAGIILSLFPKYEYTAQVAILLSSCAIVVDVLVTFVVILKMLIMLLKC